MRGAAGLNAKILGTTTLKKRLQLGGGEYTPSWYQVQDRSNHKMVLEAWTEGMSHVRVFVPADQITFLPILGSPCLNNGSGSVRGQLGAWLGYYTWLRSYSLDVPQYGYIVTKSKRLGIFYHFETAIHTYMLWIASRLPGLWLKL